MVAHRVTVVGAVYGDYHRYVPGWVESVVATGAEAVLSSDRPVDAPFRVVVSENRGEFPYNARWDEAIAVAETEWIAVLGIDDRFEPWAFDGLDEGCDVWQVGYRVPNGQIRDHMPPDVQAVELLEWSGNPFVYASPFRKSLWERVGGHRDIAFSDFALFRDFCLAGAVFGHSRRFALLYDWHHATSQSGVHQPRLREHLEAAKVTELRSK